MAIVDEPAAELSASASLETSGPAEPGTLMDNARQVGSSGTGTIRVMVAEDHGVVREGFVKALNDHSELEVVGEARDGRETVEVVRRTRPAVVVLDVTMTVMDGVEAARTITTEFPDTFVIGLSVYEPADLAEEMRKGGAFEYLTKVSASNWLVGAFRGMRPER